MIFPPTLSRYLARIYVLNLLALLGILLCVVYVFDTIELLRRASKRDDVPLSLVLEMGLLKLPEVGQVVLPFAVLFSAMFTFWQLTRRHELTVVRAAGLSVWQFLAPVVGVAIAAGVLHMAVVNPIGSVFVGKFEQMEREYLTRQKSLVTLFQGGLWLRQENPERAEESGGTGHVILHAGRLSLPEWRLKEVMALFFDGKDSFYRRVDAAGATLSDGSWIFADAQVNEPPKPSESLPEYRLGTPLTRTEIEESFASPQTMSFWYLPEYIRTLEGTGFDATRLHIHYQSLLAQPLLFAAMILLAASVSLRPPRLRGTLALIAFGVAAGFLVFFMSSYLQALGLSGQIPAFLAAWSSPLICFLLGMAVMLNLEDG